MDSSLAASWVSAIGSAGSLLGFTAYVLIMLLNRKDAVEVRQEQQAQGVAAWLSSERGDGRGDVALQIHNGGDTPVFNITCLFSLPSSQDQHSVELALIPPDTTASRPLPFDTGGISSDELYSSPAVPEMRFTDSHGTNWQRDGDGRLRRLDRRTLWRKPGAASDSEDRDDAQWQREHRERTGDRATQRHAS